MIYKTAKTITKIILSILLPVTIFSFGIVARASANTVTMTYQCNDGAVVSASSTGDNITDVNVSDIQNACASHKGYTISSSCNAGNGTGELNKDNCGIIKYLVIFINVLSAMVGVVVTGVIIWGGIEYTMSGGDPSKVQNGKKKIYNGVISLVAFLFTYAFLQYIVPGGIGF